MLLQRLDKLRFNNWNFVLYSFFNAIQRVTYVEAFCVSLDLDVIVQPHRMLKKRRKLAAIRVRNNTA